MLLVAELMSATHRPPRPRPATSRPHRFRIVADENIPFVGERFSALGEVQTVNGRDLHKAQLQNADILLVRSVTQVDSALLEGTPVKFVGSATIGTDHLDIAYLEQNTIQWTAAPGSNADSVAEYVFSAISRLDGLLEALLAGAILGIIGMGNVGSRVYQRLSALGIRCCAYDPLISQDSYPIMTDLQTVLSSDVICLHTPLTTSGAYPTLNLLDEQRLMSLEPGTVILSAGRGAVIDNQALLQVLSERDDLCVVLDVWDNEPAINIELMKRVDIATPHIAGYSFDGKLAGMEMLYAACCGFISDFNALHSGLAEPSNDKATHLAAGAEFAGEVLLEQPRDTVSALRKAILSCYDVALDDQAMRGALLHANSDQERAQAFDILRKNYPIRREFSRYTLTVQGMDEPLKNALTALGFTNIQTVD